MSDTHQYNDSYEALLMEYAAGALDQAHRLILQAHIALSAHARQRVRQYECVGGALMERQCEPVAMNRQSLDNVLARLDQPQQQPQQRAEHPRTLPIDACVPECVEQTIYIHTRGGILRTQIRQIRWKPVQQGVTAIALPLHCRSSSAFIYKLRPGMPAPITQTPARDGLQLTLVLDGALSCTDHQYTRGDLMIREAGEPAAPTQSCTQRGGVCMSVTPGAGSTLQQLLHRFFQH